MAVLKNARYEQFAQGLAKGKSIDERRFYVYTLTDPRNGEVFYVGKGCGVRMLQHEKDCRAGRVQNGRKHKRIADIIAAGTSVLAEKIKIDLTEGQALDAEKELIRSIGIRKLTNVFAGQDSIESQLIEVTKIRYAQCMQTIELADRGADVDPAWLAAEKGWRETCERTLRRFNLMPV